MPIIRLFKNTVTIIRKGEVESTTFCRNIQLATELAVRELNRLVIAYGHAHLFNQTKIYNLNIKIFKAK